MRSSLGFAIVSLALVFHAAFPRYEWHALGAFNFARIDRWTGRAEWTSIYDEAAVSWLRTTHKADDLRAVGVQPPVSAGSSADGLFDAIYGSASATGGVDAQKRLGELKTAVAALQDPVKRQQLTERGINPSAVERYLRSRIATLQREK